MDFVTVRELRAESGKIWEKIEAGEEMVITRNGKPFAIIVGTDSASLEDNLLALRRAKYSRVLAEQHKRAVELGLDKMPMEAIDEEIDAVRKEQRDRAAGSR